jgi:hypothetical protein
MVAEDGQTLSVRFGEAIVCIILAFLISFIDIPGHRFILCSSEEELPKGIGKTGNRVENAVSPRCPRDAAATTFFRSSGIAIQKSRKNPVLDFYYIK